MPEEQARIGAKRLKGYYPYRIVGAYYDVVTKEWYPFIGKTKRMQNDLLRAGYEVYVL